MTSSNLDLDIEQLLSTKTAIPACPVIPTNTHTNTTTFPESSVAPAVTTTTTTTTPTHSPRHHRETKVRSSFWYVPAIYIFGVAFLLSGLLVYWFFRRRLNRMEKELAQLHHLLLQRQSAPSPYPPPISSSSTYPNIPNIQAQTWRATQTPTEGCTLRSSACSVRFQRDPQEIIHDSRSESTSRPLNPLDEDTLMFSSHNQRKELNMESEMERQSLMKEKEDEKTSKLLTPSEMDQVLQEELAELEKVPIPTDTIVIDST